MMQHMSAVPDLSGLPECDRVVVGLALSKKPEDRFPSCLEFLRVLMAADPGTAADPALALRQARMERGATIPTALTGRHPQITDATYQTGRHPQPKDGSESTGRHRIPGEPTQNVTLGSLPRQTLRGSPTLPPLVAAKRLITPIARPTSAPPPLAEELPMAMGEVIADRKLDPDSLGGPRRSAAEQARARRRHLCPHLRLGNYGSCRSRWPHSAHAGRLPPLGRRRVGLRLPDHDSSRRHPRISCRCSRSNSASNSINLNRGGSSSARQRPRVCGVPWADRRRAGWKWPSSCPNRADRWAKSR